MKISDEWVEDYRKLTTNPTREGGACLDADTLNALAAGELAAEVRDRALDHVVDCSECATELRLAKEIRAWSEETQGQGVTSRSMGFRPAWATLAAALLAVVIGFWWVAGQRGLSEHTATVRQAGAGPAIVVPADGELLELAPTALQWAEIAGAEAYRVKVLDAAGEQVWQSPWLDHTQVAPSWGPFARGTYLWTVEVRGPVSRKRLGPFSFRVLEADPAPGS